MGVLLKHLVPLVILAGMMWSMKSHAIPGAPANMWQAAGDRAPVAAHMPHEPFVQLGIGQDDDAADALITRLARQFGAGLPAGSGNELGLVLIGIGAVTWYRGRRQHDKSEAAFPPER